MASTKEIKEHLTLALEEIGNIKPWFDEEVQEWIFSHPLYPVEYGGKTPKEVIKNYPKYLREFIKYRLDNKLNPRTESKTKGHGGKREGAGRPKGSSKEITLRISLPKDVALWMKKHPESMSQIRRIMNA